MTRQQAIEVHAIIQQVDGAIQKYASGIAMARDALPDVLHYCEQLQEAELDDIGKYLIWLIELYANKNIHVLRTSFDTESIKVEAGPELELSRLVCAMQRYLLTTQ